MNLRAAKGTLTMLVFICCDTELPAIEEEMNIEQDKQDVIDAVLSSPSSHTSTIASPPSLILSASLPSEDIMPEPIMDDTTSRTLSFGAYVGIHFKTVLCLNDINQEQCFRMLNARKKTRQDVTKSRKRTADRDGDDESFGIAKHSKRRWTDDEAAKLMEEFGKDITDKKMPSGTRLHAFCAKVSSRTIAQVRTQVHNYISGKTVNKTV
jgi:hypothetical protein